MKPPYKLTLKTIEELLQDELTDAEKYEGLISNSAETAVSPLTLALV